MTKREVSWKEIEDMSDILANKLKKKRFDSILAINRGGLVLGRILSDKLNVPMGVISARAYKIKNKEKTEIKFDTNISMVGPLEGKVLLVDDLVDQGRTLRIIKEWLLLNKKDIKKITTAVLFNCDEADFEPDYYADFKDDWIIFPYEKTEFKHL